MRTTTCIRIALTGTAIASCILLAAPSVQACLFSNVASAFANGIAARPVTTVPTTARAKVLWAPFAFQQIFRAGQVLHLRENMGEVARSMGRQALHWPVHWLFGDGTHATGVAVTHVYRHPGRYRIEVQSYFVGNSGLKGWYDFDVVSVTVAPGPATIRR